MLRRLETQGLLTSEWREEEKRNKRFYRLSADGRAVLARLTEEWRALNASVTDILKGES
jgi:PadR family transcriptional regulator PadR